MPRNDNQDSNREDIKMKKLLTSAAAFALAASLAPASFAGGHKSYTIGVSNTVQGNGWREQMICAMRAQALVEGDVTNIIVAHRNTDSAGQLEDINNLIEAGVDLLEVQKILGHRSVLTTAKYTHLTSNTTQNAKQLIDELMNGFSIDWGKIK